MASSISSDTKNSVPALRRSPAAAARRWLGRLALTTAVLTFPLITVGGGVTSKDAGMVYETAPLSNGALVNPAGWTQRSETLLEHGHRLIGWCVGLAALATAVLASVAEPRRPVRWLAVAALGAVTLQGIMGIWRVNHDSANWAMVHGVWGQITFSLVACVACVTSRAWRRSAASEERGIPGNCGLQISHCELGERLSIRNPQSAIRNDRRGSAQEALPDGHGSAEYGSAERAAARTAAALWGVLIVQVILGVLTRHTGRGFPWHFMVAMGVAVLAARLAFIAFAELPRIPLLRRAAGALVILVGLQWTLGMSALVITGGSSARVVGPGLFEWIIPTAHVAVGALILAATACMTLIGYASVGRLSRPAIGSGDVQNPQEMDAERSLTVAARAGA